VASCRVCASRRFDVANSCNLLSAYAARKPNPDCAQDITASAVAATSKGCFWNQDVAGLVAGLPGVAVTYRRDALGSLVALVEAQRAREAGPTPAVR
jgi:hypothetical protein